MAWDAENLALGYWEYHSHGKANPFYYYVGGSGDGTDLEICLFINIGIYYMYIYAYTYIKAGVDKNFVSIFQIRVRACPGIRPDSKLQP